MIWSTLNYFLSRRGLSIRLQIYVRIKLYSAQIIVCSNLKKWQNITFYPRLNIIYSTVVLRHFVLQIKHLTRKRNMCGSDYKRLHYSILFNVVVHGWLSNEGCDIDILYGCDQVVTYIITHCNIYQEVVTIVNLTSASSMTGLNHVIVESTNLRKPIYTTIHISKNTHINYISLTRALHVQIWVIPTMTLSEQYCHLYTGILACSPSFVQCFGSLTPKVVSFHFETFEKGAMTSTSPILRFIPTPTFPLPSSMLVMPFTYDVDLGR